MTAHVVIKSDLVKRITNMQRVVNGADARYWQCAHGSRDELEPRSVTLCRRSCHDGPWIVESLG